ncbi:phosphate ABC transporter permease subunit PstC [Palleronia sediminis]|uniref:Phosphate transport system permease protein n=1 Tax=Palleronia sediminis TaxID=2547833 RepID=A0A4R6AJU0_9RHOB|nr:phosphate ABC transporter permease subunit PstC [Palleronia sediminis]TDL83625.1 phosphate ABC transporter permease subunit PstC [Palleronia sediminis]
MPVILILATLAAIAVAAFVMGRARALRDAGGDTRKLHSRPPYYGADVALAGLVPALALLLAWLAVEPLAIDARIKAAIPDTAVEAAGTRDLAMGEVERLATGLAQLRAIGRIDADGIAALDADGADAIRARLADAGVALGASVEPWVLDAARDTLALREAGRRAMTLAVLAAALIGSGLTWRRVDRHRRARNIVERAIRWALLAAASIAVLTTLGIVLSMLFESINFFRQYPASEFFFGTTWAPNFRGDSDLAILPLLWGTLYISIIALIVAVPIGLFAAIYLAEYAGPRVRSVVKPLLEVLAGIPTIVYGLFALMVVGPALRDYFAQPLGLGSSSSSVMTAGLVMGIMLIPFVSSLSDDIISAVPDAMRDGSLGLGATRSETIRQVVLPAALPGIVGAVLLAASRAIGETMIVVLGAGAAARLDLNPFEAMTTVTVKIVSQLTGDTNFASPETLVSFALGLTLFVITLALNVLALYIVRRYREQYE